LDEQQPQRQSDAHAEHAPAKENLLSIFIFHRGILASFGRSMASIRGTIPFGESSAMERLAASSFRS
jgi:hypothetical protein